MHSLSPHHRCAAKRDRVKHGVVGATRLHLQTPRENRWQDVHHPYGFCC